MLLEKGIAGYQGRMINASKYQCDMCRKCLTKEERILIYTSEPGGDVQRKKWDVCERCMKILEKNVNLWYDKIVNKNK